MRQARAGERNSSYYVKVREINNVSEMQKEVTDLIEKSGGSVDNLSVIYDCLKRSIRTLT